MDHETVAAYLNRVGVTGPAAGDAAGLRTLHRAHQMSVPFENLSIHLSEPISSPPFDHLALIVRPADGSGPWLADVGFGSHSDYPLLLDGRGDQDDPAGRFRDPVRAAAG